MRMTQQTMSAYIAVIVAAVITGEICITSKSEKRTIGGTQIEWLSLMAFSPMQRHRLRQIKPDDLGRIVPFVTLS